MICFESVSLRYGEKQVLDRVTLRAAPGEHIALMGPSGCGKTSLLHLAAKLIQPTSGQVISHARRLAFAFQEPRLLPRRTALQNVNAVLSDGPSTLPKAMEALEAVGLAADGQKMPRELSGGMAQRVNLARALAYEGDLLLLDEPLKELDQTRREDILSLLQKSTEGKTLLVTTHDPTLALALADTVYIFRDGTFVQS